VGLSASAQVLISFPHLLTASDCRLLLNLLEYDDISCLFDDSDVRG
jgi:hypothetical protein